MGLVSKVCNGPTDNTKQPPSKGLQAMTLNKFLPTCGNAPTCRTGSKCCVFARCALFALSSCMCMVPVVMFIQLARLDMIVHLNLNFGLWAGLEKEDSIPYVVQQQVDRISSGETWQKQWSQEFQPCMLESMKARWLNPQKTVHLTYLEFLHFNP